MFNIVEALAASEDCAFDQPCKFGHRVKGHAVYCHNYEWKEAPRKCRRGEGWAGLYGIPPESNRHEDCTGYAPNPDYLTKEQTIEKAKQEHRAMVNRASDLGIVIPPMIDDEVEDTDK